MKNIYFILAILVLLTQGCNDFLEPKSQDKVVPKTVSQLRELLLGEIIQNKKDYTEYLSVMTDDFADQDGNQYEYRNQLWGYYTWQREPEEGRDLATRNDEAWSELYHAIFTCNIIIDKTPSMHGTDEEKNQLLAETYFMRAQAYFELINLYGEPYESAEQAEKALGVPINEEITIMDNIYSRETLAKVYAKIESDLHESIARFKNTEWTKNVVHPSLDVAYLFASRLHLYKKEYQSAKNYADSVINNERYQLYDLHTAGLTSYSYFINRNNPEIMFCYGMASFDFIYNYSSTYATYLVSDKIISLFSNDDLRKTTFWDKNKKPHKFSSTNSQSYGNTYRLSEAYLNRAEALVFLDKWESAITDINTIREKRIKNDYEITATNREDALNKVWEERRRELCFEKHRWFDLRRQGMPELRHIFTNGGSRKEYILPAGSKSYTLPIPKKIREQNKIIVNIERPEQL